MLPLTGCGVIDGPVLDPKGPIALAERDLLFTAAALMLIVIIPVYLMAFWFAWHYRVANKQANYKPDWDYSVRIDALVWAVPTLIVIGVGSLVWIWTHHLDPYKPLHGGEPLNVQVVAQDWKFLFIYPEQNIAAVNELVFPSDRPVSLALTSDTVMNSFYVPALAGQIYVMAGMETRLNLSAHEPGQFTGRNTQYSGAGFSDQNFQVHAVSPAEFEAWIASAKQTPKPLDEAAYAALARPSRKVSVGYYSEVTPKLFASIIAKYRGAGHAAHAAESE
ncbi:MAG: ubiquinol oxidase subunit II [Rhizobiales bacterium]|nr:ubiquinol oxidase subunit II [Hyphomicrobiales bacterium]